MTISSYENLKAWIESNSGLNQSELFLGLKLRNLLENYLKEYYEKIWNYWIWLECGSSLTGNFANACKK